MIDEEFAEVATAVFDLYLQGRTIAARSLMVDDMTGPQRTQLMDLCDDISRGAYAATGYLHQKNADRMQQQGRAA